MTHSQLDGTIDFNPLDPALNCDPYPVYRRLRADAPMLRLEDLNMWVLTRYTDCAAALSHPALKMEYRQFQMLRQGESVVDEPFFQLMARQVTARDGVDHRRLRALSSAAFTAKRVNELTERTKQIAADLVTTMKHDPVADLVESFSLRVPLAVISLLLGVPQSDYELIEHWSHAMKPAVQFLPMTSEQLAAANDAVLGLDDYFRQAIESRKAHPRDDLLTATIAAADENTTDEELSANSWALYVAGHETSANAISLSVIAMLTHRTQWELLRSHPELVKSAAMECLRFDTPGQATARMATAPLELGGQQIAQGSVVVTYIGAANRDPEQFDNPDVLDITRGKRGLSFGAGAHTCLGQLLSRMESEVALGILTEMVPDLDFAAEPEFSDTPVMRGVEHLAVTY
jgi:cytochrome P450